MTSSAEIYKTTIEPIKTQKVTNTSNFISQLEPSAPKEIWLKSKIPTDVSFLSGTGVSITP